MRAPHRSFEAPRSEGTALPHRHARASPPWVVAFPIVVRGLPYDGECPSPSWVSGFPMVVRAIPHRGIRPSHRWEGGLPTLGRPFTSVPRAFPIDGDPSCLHGDHPSCAWGRASMWMGRASMCMGKSLHEAPDPSHVPGAVPSPSWGSPRTSMGKTPHVHGGVFDRRLYDERSSFLAVDGRSQKSEPGLSSSEGAWRARRAAAIGTARWIASAPARSGATTALTQ